MPSLPPIAPPLIVDKMKNCIAGYIQTKGRRYMDWWDKVNREPEISYEMYENEWPESINEWKKYFKASLNQFFREN